MHGGVIVGFPDDPVQLVQQMWPNWEAWLSEMSGEMVPARVPDDRKLKVLVGAPGAYVLD